MQHTLSSILLVTALLHQGIRVSSVAPGDQQSQCFDTSNPNSPGHELINAYTETQKPLLDSYWYSILIDQVGVVWKSIGGNNDSTGVSDQ